MMFAPVLVAVMRLIVMWMVVEAFKMIFRWLNRELAEPVQHERIRRASARILSEEDMHWGESDSHAIVRYKSHDV